MTDDNDTLSTLSREDALTLECENTEEEFQFETYIVDVSDDEDADYPDTETDSGIEDADDSFWPTDEQVAAWEDADAAWRNLDAYYGGGDYDPNGEI